jgi:hypothetical protein
MNTARVFCPNAWVAMPKEIQVIGILAIPAEPTASLRADGLNGRGRERLAA